MATDAIVWGPGGEAIPHDEVAQRRRIAAAMLAKERGQPMGWSQGLAQGLDKVLAAMMYRDANAQGQANAAYSGGLMDKLFTGGAGGNPAAAPGMNVPAPQAAAPPPPTSPAWPDEDTAGAVPGGTTDKQLSWGGDRQPIVNLSGNKAEFVKRMLPAAMDVSQRTGIDPRIIVGQAAIETGWGRSAPGNNYFGIKSHGQPGGNTLATTEVVNGRPVREMASFRAYASPEDSVKGYGDFVTQNKRYAGLRSAQGIDSQLSELQRSGYATDPNYSNKVGSVARAISMPSAGQPTQVASLGGAVPTGGNPAAAPAMPPEAIEQQAALSQAEPSWQEASALPNFAPPQRQAPPPVSPAVQRVAQALPQIDPRMAIQIMRDQRVSPGEKQVVQFLLQRQEAEANRRNEINKPTDDMREYNLYTQQEKAAGRQPVPFRDYMLDYKRASATNVKVNSDNTAETTYSKGKMEQALKLEAGVDKDLAERQRLEVFKHLNEQFNTGKMAPAQATVGAWAEALGIDPKQLGLPENAALNGQLIEQMSNQMTLGMIGGKGDDGGMPANNFSNTDLKFLTDSMPSLSRTKGANAIMIELKARALDRKLEKAQMWDEARSNGTSFEKFERDWRKHVNSQPSLFADMPEKIKALSAQSGAGAGGAPQVQEGATATNPQTGQKLIFKGGRWLPQ